MAAFTTLADGSVRRWHADPLDECDREDCLRDHATLAELLAVDLDDELAVAFDRGTAEGRA